jgi:hypothetical protein
MATIDGRLVPFSSHHQERIDIGNGRIRERQERFEYFEEFPVGEERAK